MESVWPEGCPPHEPGLHLRGDGFDDAVIDREPSPEEQEWLQDLFDESGGDLSLEALVARHAQVGIGVVWLRRRHRL
jgi:hypothetical protein